MMFDGSADEALFQIEGPDDDGCVWICSPAGSPDTWCQNLGPKNKAVEALSRWLRSVGETGEFRRYERSNPG